MLIGEDVALETRIAPAAGPVLADPGHIEQVILNLAVNARDAMPGGGRLRIAVEEVAADDPTLRADPSLPPGPLVRLTVEDSGVGMDEPTLARIFEPFFTTKPTGKGTGLGLSTVYGIVTQSGGAVRVESAPGRGTAFHVLFPSAAREGRGAAPAGPVEPARGDEAVLLVEDDAQVRALTARALVKAGYRVVEASCPNEAVAAARRTPFELDLLLTDVVLPEASGVELAATLSRDRPGLRVLYVSGHTAGHLPADEVFAAGHAFLAKPFTPEALLRRVRELLDAPAPAVPGGVA